MSISSKQSLYSSLCMSIVDHGNSIALRFLDYPGIGKADSSRRIDSLAIAFLDISCALFRVESGVDSVVVRPVKQKPSSSGGIDRLHDDLRLISATFTDLDRFLLKRSVDDYKQSFSLFGRSRGVHAEIEKLQKALEQGLVKLQLAIGALPGSDLHITNPGSGYTDLLSLFENRLKKRSQNNVAVFAALARKEAPPEPAISPSFGRFESQQLTHSNFENDTASVMFSDLAGITDSFNSFWSSGTPADGEPDQNLLHLAVSISDLDSMRLLLQFGAQVDARDRAGITPLYAATEVMFLAGAQLLLQHGADPNLHVEAHGETPFALSLAEGRDHFALLYLDNGAHVDTPLANGNTPLIQAIETASDGTVVELMLEKGADPNRKNNKGETALFRAISVDRIDHVTNLLAHNANPNLPGPKHMLWPAVHKTPILEMLLAKGANLKLAPGILELATSTNSVEAVTLLLRYGADPNAKKDGIYTPLCSAIRDDREQLVDLLLQAKADPNLAALDYPTFKCVTYHRPHLLPKVLDAGADIHHPKGIVEACVEKGEAECLKILIKYGANVNERGASGNTALTTAIKHGDHAMLDLLLANGANPAVRGQEWPVNLAVADPAVLQKLLQHLSPATISKGALERAVMADQLASVKMLLAAGVDVEDRNGGVFSALTTSIREARKDIFYFLLDSAGADPNSPGEHLPIIKAIRRHRADDLSYIQHLLECGADMNLMYRGWNAVLQALDNGEAEVFRLLARSGSPDLEARDESGRTVLEIMRERGMREELEILMEGSGGGSKEVREALRGLRSLVQD
ncbi:hypothetical protein WHR41_02715 [Cladosporium halotolerans]|uniref:Ankyrin repeat protein n=1 Tax=Cladosporium halotolerans TaxID=1052096 RepID=A0AB34KXW1_9PEZI